jgi:hypothetical protein
MPFLLLSFILNRQPISKAHSFEAAIFVAEFERILSGEVPRLVFC